VLVLLPVIAVPPSLAGDYAAPGRPDLAPYAGWSWGQILVRSEGRRIDARPLPRSFGVRTEDLDRLMEGLLAAWREEAYLLSRIGEVRVVPDSAARRVDLAVTIEPGPLCRVAAVTLEGNRTLAEETFAGLTGLVVGSPLRESMLQDGPPRVVSWYLDHGHPHAEVRFDDFRIDPEGGVRLTVRCREERRVRVGGIAVRGNRVTRRDVVLRQFGIASGADLSMSEIARGRERLLEAGIYRSVEEIALVRTENPYVVDLEVAVDEGRPNTFSGAAGLVPGVGGGLRPTGRLRLHLGNLMGTGRKAEVDWTGLGRGVSRLDLKYVEPWIAGTPMSGEVRFTQELRDSVYNRIEFAFTGAAPIGGRFRGRIGLEHQRIFSAVPGETAGTRNRRLSLRLGVERDAAAREGGVRTWGMRVGFLIGRRAVDDRAFGEMEGEGMLRLTLWRGRRKDLLLTTGGRFVDTPLRPVPEYHRFSIGGGAGVRGWAEDRIRGNRAAWQRLEMRFRLARDSRCLLFYDAGIVDVVGDGDGGTWLQGYGAGVRLGTGVGSMRVDYALRPGLAPLAGRIHAGWDRDF
jgi:outer membrane protein assembly factor BamA